MEIKTVPQYSACFAITLPWIYLERALYVSIFSSIAEYFSSFYVSSGRNYAARNELLQGCSLNCRCNVTACTLWLKRTPGRPWEQACLQGQHFVLTVHWVSLSSSWGRVALFSVTATLYRNFWQNIVGKHLLALCSIKARTKGKKKNPFRSWHSPH